MWIKLWFASWIRKIFSTYLHKCFRSSQPCIKGHMTLLPHCFHAADSNFIFWWLWSSQAPALCFIFKEPQSLYNGLRKAWSPAAWPLQGPGQQQLERLSKPEQPICSSISSNLAQSEYQFRVPTASSGQDELGLYSLAFCSRNWSRRRRRRRTRRRRRRRRQFFKAAIMIHYMAFAKTQKRIRSGVFSVYFKIGLNLSVIKITEFHFLPNDTFLPEL